MLQAVLAALMCLCAQPSIAQLADSAFEPLGLQLERTLSGERGRATPVNSLPLTYDFGVRDLQSRVESAYDDVRAMETRHQLQLERLQASQEVAEQLRKLLEAKEQTRAALSEQAGLRDAIRATPVGEQASATAQTAAPAGMVAPPANGEISGFSSSIHPWMVYMGLGAVIALLLAWALFLSGRASARDEEINMLELALSDRSQTQSIKLAAEQNDIGPRTDGASPFEDEDREDTSLEDAVISPKTAPESVFSAVTPCPAMPVNNNLPEDLDQPLEADFATQSASETVAERNETVASAVPDRGDPPASGGEGVEVMEWTAASVQGRSAEPEVLKEIDILIAFENYEQAQRLLDELLKINPTNPEYRLRMLHLKSAMGEEEESAQEEEILAAMMDGPMSETIHRVKQMGRDLLPGHPLFDAPANTSSDKDPATSKD